VNVCFWPLRDSAVSDPKQTVNSARQPRTQAFPQRCLVDDLCHSQIGQRVTGEIEHRALRRRTAPLEGAARQIGEIRFVGPANVMRPEAVRTRVCSRSSVARMSIARSVPRFHERARSTAPTNAPGVTQAVSRNSRTCAPSGTVVMIASRPSMASRGSSVVRATSPAPRTIATNRSALAAERLHATTSIRSGNTRRRTSKWLRACTPHPVKPIETLSARASFCTVIAVIAAGRFAEFHAATKAGRDRGDLPPHSNSISGGLDATLPADAK